MSNLAPTEFSDQYGWIQLYTGFRFDVPEFPDNLSILDVAHALSMQCRYGGHCLQFYSVAEHCRLLYDWCRVFARSYRYDALMHDATEAVLQDIPRAVKGLLPDYKRIEAQVEQVFAKRWMFTAPVPALVKEIDNRILLDERAQNMAPYRGKSPTLFRPVGPVGFDYCEAEADGWPFGLSSLGVQLQFWTPQVAEAKFLEAFYECSPLHY